MPNVIDLIEIADESESSRFTATFFDLSGNTLDEAAINTLVMTLQNELDGAIINGRDADNILNTGGGTVAADGTLTLKLSGDDNAIVIRTDEVEMHIMTIEWAWVDEQGVPQTATQKWRLRVAPKMPSPSDPSVVIPAQSDVREGVGYGVGGVEYIGTLEPITVNAVASTEDVWLIRGDSYTGERSIKWVDPGSWPDLTNATFEFTSVNSRGRKIITGVPTWDNDKTLSMELTSDETDVASLDYKYDVVAKWNDGRQVQLVRGFTRVAMKYTKV